MSQKYCARIGLHVAWIHGHQDAATRTYENFISYRLTNEYNLLTPNDKYVATAGGFKTRVSVFQTAGGEPARVVSQLSDHDPATECAGGEFWELRQGKFGKPAGSFYEETGPNALPMLSNCGSKPA